MVSRSYQRGFEVDPALLLIGVVLISTSALRGTVAGVATTVALIGAAAMAGTPRRRQHGIGPRSGSSSSVEMIGRAP